ncbi:FAD-dependent thymidylate synthase [Candidatus Chloroploca sp. M-50]|uniref:FAD-dependent thymidylate synthase n=1 Tax=Candidatus Chloroploca mongolica TaxID=2528176 RepID=A0ABS4D4D7_9CHLR|nr:FAD-dependent thymidylate synthase [Candidatus Chloroploca mongolica]MBP1464293.1 FAD-dependent thymidylate synthase [Candidatus Chloroploca mongolica]
MFEPNAERFTPQEIALLQPFVTNTERPIFCLRNLPEVVKGALFSRYSRSTKSLRRLLLDEFISEPESGFHLIVAGAGNDPAAQLVAVKQAEAFYERVLVGYGDDSVAELGGAHLACEGVSNIAAKVLEDSRLGLSPLEKSTRYVRFDQQGPEGYAYLREPALMASPYAARFTDTMDHLFGTYSALLAPVQAWVQTQFPRDPATSQRAYASATQAKAFDLLRGLLPMATCTNVGLFGNGRAFEYLLTKLAATPFAETQQLGQAMQAELDLVIPAFVKRSKGERGRAYATYIAALRERVADIAAHIDVSHPSQEEVTVRLVDYDPEAEGKMVAAILYPHLDLPLTAIQERVEAMPEAERVALIEAALGERASRFHRPGRAFEEPYYSFDILADIGAYRDLQRHRVLTQERQHFTVAHGFVVPPELEEVGVAHIYSAALQQAAEVCIAMQAEFPHEAQYAVPFSFRVRWRIKLNLREAYHLIELRSARQGHPSYRQIAQAMFRAISAVHPTLARGMHFVDQNDYGLERLTAEQRLDQKRQAQEG